MISRWFLGLWILIWILFAIRVHYVAKYRARLLEAVGIVVDRDIASGRAWMWRYEAIREPSFNKMCWMFWRSFDSFYPRKDFLK